MANSSDSVAVYLEVRKKRTLAGAIEWPGWCRGGRDEEGALQALMEYGPRYGRVLHGTGLRFQAPKDTSAFTVTERVVGNATTDFGAPDVPPANDTNAVDDAELRRLQEILKASWGELDAAARAAEGKVLRKGPRGGGRELAGIVEHVLGAEASYLRSLGGKLERTGDKEDGDGTSRAVKRQREAILKTLEAAAHGEIAPQGPRGGARWTPRFFVRRAVWHILDHVWEIEDRIME